jgi:hypothetical protein
MLNSFVISSPGELSQRYSHKAHQTVAITDWILFARELGQIASL